MKIVEVENFTPEIYNRILCLNEILLPGTAQMSEDVLRAIIESENSHLLLISQNEIVLGMLTMGVYMSPTGKKAWIEDVVVHTNWQGRGIGRQLMMYAIELAKRLNVDKLMLTSNKNRIVANALYQSLDFMTKETNIYQMFV